MDHDRMLCDTHMPVATPADACGSRAQMVLSDLRWSVKGPSHGSTVRFRWWRDASGGDVLTLPSHSYGMILQGTE